jgi:hypothetical protein
MTVVPNVGHHCIFPVCFRHKVVSVRPCSRCVVKTFVRRTGLLEKVGSVYVL